jgi:lysophospholipase L1-like esterase
MYHRAAVLLALLLWLFSAEGQDAPFKNGDRVCFAGNSITHEGRFHHDISLYYATRFPLQRVDFFNGGISGNVTTQVIDRFYQDILIHRPDFVVIMIGMNDVNRNLYSATPVADPDTLARRKAALDHYKKNLESLVVLCLKSGVRPVLQTPSIFDQTTVQPKTNNLGVNDALKTCSAYIKEIAGKYHLKVIDYWTLMQSVNERIQKKDPAATVVSPDRVHPGEPGSLVMAYAFLRATGAPKYIASINIQSAAGSMTCHNCRTRLNFHSTDSLSFFCKESALPYPTTPGQQAALEWIPFTENLNRELLTIKGLKRGSYRLTIDAADLGNFTERQLATGINLAYLTNTPQYRQAEAVRKLMESLWQVEAHLRSIRLVECNGLLKEKLKYATDDYLKARLEEYPALKSREKQLEEQSDSLRDKIYAINQPVEHIFRLTPTDTTVFPELTVRNGLPNFFSKLQHGDPVRIAYFGGSITAQEGWRPQSLNWLQQRFPKAAFSEINAAIGGTGSEFGVFRLQEHVLQYRPDLIFIEFAVNEAVSSPESIIRNFDEIIRQVWRKLPGTDICFVYTIKEDFLATESKGHLPASAITMEKIADHYGIPSINFGFEICQQVALKQMIFKGPAEKLNGIPVFSPDGVHPYSETGHVLYTQVFKRSFEIILPASHGGYRPHVLPTPIAPYYYSSPKMVDLSENMLSKGWEFFQPAEQKEFIPFGKYFDRIGKATGSGETLTIHFKGKVLGIWDLMGPGSGRITVETDGPAKDTIWRFDEWTTYWRVNTFMIANLENKEHRVIFRTLSEPFDKASILARRNEKITGPKPYRSFDWCIGKILIDGELLP